MASNAYLGHLEPLLSDAIHLCDASIQLPAGLAGRSFRVAALNRAIVVTCVSAWEAYIEELVREALNVLRPTTTPLGVWPVHNASIRGLLGRFNNPNPDNIRTLLSDALGLPEIHLAWTWQNCTSSQAVQRLAEVMSLRHQIAHGVNPRPFVGSFYASKLPAYFDHLGRCTDRAVRNHLATVLGIADPWPL